MGMKEEAEDLLREIRNKIDDLIDKAKDASEDVREEMDETIENLKKQREKLEGKMEDFRIKNEPKIEEAKHHLRVALDEIGKAFEKMFRKGPRAEESKD